MAGFWLHPSDLTADRCSTSLSGCMTTLQVKCPHCGDEACDGVTCIIQTLLNVRSPRHSRPTAAPTAIRPCSGHTVALTSLYQHMAALLSPCSAYRACHALSCCVARGNLQEMDTFTHALRQPHIRPVPAHCCIPLPAVSLQSLPPFAVLCCAALCVATCRKWRHAHTHSASPS